MKRIGRNPSALSKLKRRGDEGVALMMALLFIVLLTAIVVEFVYEMEVEASYVAGTTWDFEAYVAARSAIANGVAVLAEDLIFQDEDQNSSGELFDGRDEPWAEGISYQAMNDAQMRCTIDDEYGKLNLNALIRTDPENPDDPGEDNEMVIRALQLLLLERTGVESPEELVDAILDWMDIDDEPREAGLETDYYLGLEVPFRAKNGRFTSVEELLLIPGITPEVYYGDEEIDELPLDALLTVYGDPEGRVNANTAPEEVLFALGEAFYDAFRADWVERIEDFLEERDAQGSFDTIESLREFFPPVQVTQSQPARSRRKRVDGIAPKQLQPSRTLQAQHQPRPRRPNTQVDLQPPFLIASGVFRLRGYGISGEVKTRIETFVARDPSLGEATQPMMFKTLAWHVVR